MSYETANWHKLSPAFRAAFNRKRHAQGLAPIPPPIKDEYVAPVARPVASVEIIDSELRAEYQRETQRFDTMLRNGMEGFSIAGQRVEGLEVVELPNNMGFEGIREGYRGTVEVSEGFSIRR